IRARVQGHRGRHDAAARPCRTGHQAPAARRGEGMIADVGAQLGLAYAFVEREVALSKRYWAWEIVWLVYGIVTSLSVAYIGLAAPLGGGGLAAGPHRRGRRAARVGRVLPAHDPAGLDADPVVHLAGDVRQPRHARRPSRRRGSRGGLA